jgi:hypothetical protein
MERIPYWVPWCEGKKECERTDHGRRLRPLRLRSSISVHGTLLHPAVGVDPGLAKDKDCFTVLSQADVGVE